MKFSNKKIEAAIKMLEDEIINYLKSKGGSALQSQIQHDLGFAQINCNCNPEGKMTKGWFCGALLRSLYDQKRIERTKLSPRAISWSLLGHE